MKPSQLRSLLRTKQALSKPEAVARIQEARKTVDPEPTDAQKEVGNYAKGHVNIHGLNITIENPKGATRSGTSKSGVKWQVKMKHDYGYFKRTEGKDGDNVDCFIGDHPHSEAVFIINQIDPSTGRFDEHKVVLGCVNAEDAKATYLGNYSEGWKGFGSMTAMTMPQFREWLDSGDTTKKAAPPVAKPPVPTSPAKLLAKSSSAEDWQPWETMAFEWHKNADARPAGTFGTGDAARVKLPFRESAEAILHDNGHIVGQFVPGATPGSKYLKLPGGGIDDGEELLAGLKRELMEEAGAEASDLVPHGKSEIIWHPDMAKAKPEKYHKYRGSRRYVFAGKLMSRAKPTSTEGDAMAEGARIPIGEAIDWVEQQIANPEHDAHGGMLEHRKLQMKALQAALGSKAPAYYDPRDFNATAKSASPKWVSMLPSLSQGARDMLAKSLPQNVTRQTSQAALGAGMMGKVYTGFTGGGVGDSVIKKFDQFLPYVPKPFTPELASRRFNVPRSIFNDPAHAADVANLRTRWDSWQKHLVNARAEGGGSGNRTMIPDQAQNFVNTMQSSPIFAQTHHATPVGHVMEPLLARMPANGEHAGAFIDRIKSIPSIPLPDRVRLQRYGEQGFTGLPDFHILPSKASPSGTFVGDLHGDNIMHTVPSMSATGQLTPSRRVIADPQFASVYNPLLQRLNRRTSTLMNAKSASEDAAIPDLLRAFWKWADDEYQLTKDASISDEEQEVFGLYVLSTFEEAEKAASMKCPECGASAKFKKLGDAIKCSECEKTSDIDAWFKKMSSEGLDALLGGMEPERRDRMETALANFGIGPKYVPKPEKFHQCPKCGEHKAVWRTAHDGTEMEEMELRCRGCGKTTERRDMPEESFSHAKLSNVVIDQPKGSRKEFGLKGYPLKGVTYPTDYGSHPGYVGQDDSDLDFFQGTGDRHGEMDVWRPDVQGEIETKVLHGVTPEEEAAILKEFAPVVRAHRQHETAKKLMAALSRFSKPVEKSAAFKEMGKKVRVETHEDECCPHCDYVFPEKGGPRITNHDDYWEKAAPAIYECHQCHGKFTDAEMDDAAWEEKYKDTANWLKDGMRERRKQRQQWKKDHPDWDKETEKNATMLAPGQLISYVPGRAMESVRKHGLLSGDELSKPENREALELARSGEGGDTADAWLKEREERKAAQPWNQSYAGVSALFGPADDAKIGEKHPVKRFNAVPVKVNLQALLAKHPGTKIHGSELVPFGEEIGKIPEDKWDAMSDEEKTPMIARRHRDLSVDEVHDLIRKAHEHPQEFWKHFNDAEGKRYAGDVPHAHVITPHGKIDPEFLEFPGQEKSAAMLPLTVNAALWLHGSEKGDDEAKEEAAKKKHEAEVAAEKERQQRMEHEAVNTILQKKAEHVMEDGRILDLELLAELAEKNATAEFSVLVDQACDENRVQRKIASIIPLMRRAKDYSDQKQFKQKAEIMRALLVNHADDFHVDEDDGGHVVGITHKSGFRMHLPRTEVPPELLAQRLLKEAAVGRALGKVVSTFRAPNTLRSIHLPASTGVRMGAGKIMEAAGHHAELDALRQGLGSAKPAFSFNVPHPETGVSQLHNVYLGDGVVNTAPSHAFGSNFPNATAAQEAQIALKNNRQLVAARIHNTHTGEAWDQPLYRSSGQTSQNLPGVNSDTTGHWLPTRGVYGATPEYAAQVAKTTPGFQAPTVPQGVRPQLTAAGQEPGWIGKYQYDPTVKNWVTHDKTNNTLLPVYQHLRDAMGEYMGGATKLAAAAPVPTLQNTGPEAIQRALESINMAELEKQAHADIKSGKVTRRDKAVRTLNIIEGLRRNKIEPKHLMISKVPVIPAIFRPFSVAGNTFVPGDANELYRDLFTSRDVYREHVRDFGHQNAGDARLTLYGAMKAVTGHGDPVNAKTEARGVSGFLQKLVGTSPKHSFMQARMLAKPVDTVGRGVIVPNPDLNLDQIGIPEEMAWTIMAPYVQRRLVQSGISPTDAVIAIKNRDDRARKALELETAEGTGRPGILSRAPAWHKHSIVGAWLKIVPGHTIQINPYISTGMNADYDGDTCNVHVPAMPESVQEVKDHMLPSKMIFTIRDPDKVMPALKHEQIMGLHTAAVTPPKNRHIFSSHGEALAAIKRGDVPLSDEIEIGVPKGPMLARN